MDLIGLGGAVGANAGSIHNDEPQARAAHAI